MRALIVLALFAATPAPAAPAPVRPAALAQDHPALRLVGLTVVGAGGERLGEVSAVLAGRPGPGALQVLVQPSGFRAGGARALPVSSLSAEGDRLRAPVTRAEFAAMPAVAPAPAGGAARR